MTNDLIERARRDEEEDRKWAYPPIAAVELRELEQPVAKWMSVETIHSIAYCAVCDCQKSGDRDVPNVRTEACGDPDCHCHDEAQP